MKKSITLILILSFFQISAQTEKKYILKSDISYSFSTFKGSYYNNFEKARISNLNISFRGGKIITNKFNYGIGFEYDLSMVRLFPSKEIESSVITYSPIFYVQYTKAIFNKFSFALDVYSKYDFNISKTSYIPPEGYIIIYDNSVLKKQFLNFGIRPIFRVDIKENMGIDFTFGLTQFKFKTADSSSNLNGSFESEFNLNFKPEAWSVGFWLSI